MVLGDEKVNGSAITSSSPEWLSLRDAEKANANQKPALSIFSDIALVVLTVRDGQD
jgi:hypothetical protein